MSETCSDVEIGGGGEAQASLDFGRAVDPTSTVRIMEIMPTKLRPPRFSDLPTSLI